MLPLALVHAEAIKIIQGCWLAFYVVWLTSAFSAKRTKERWSSGTGLAYLGANVLTFYLLLGSRHLGDDLLIHHGHETSLVAAILCVAGVAIAIWARFSLGRNWSGSITYKEDHELVEKGPYRWVRHPIYTGMLLMVIGTAIAKGTPDALAAIVLFFAIHVWKFRQEEALMTRHFPDAYPAYLKRTKALLPGIF